MIGFIRSSRDFQIAARERKAWIACASQPVVRSVSPADLPSPRRRDDIREPLPRMPAAMRMTPAPKSASMRTQVGRARTRDRSSARQRDTVRPAIILEIAGRVG
jgi:hypothetical protein